MRGKDKKRQKKVGFLKGFSPLYLSIIQLFCIIGLFAGCANFIYDFILLGIILKDDYIWFAFIESTILITISGYILWLILKNKSEKK